ncbi:uncharacterized protein LY89DRAFT_604316 [Mollisia scopiformis]|uniref:Carboxymuconolactone decarboxylase-like domain-containing protein n=1 Tax=Mollisia scopiformis TaxID=149040 RepID=A0A194XVH2_MOLSC|nr:uncharacterized protein LY89DRAFT_604316 [Mollisia scopiformis]KUJ24009.1 hypothetical protein LY89DRAFT_604316 [Mollisia scopiformis]
MGSIPKYEAPTRDDAFKLFQNIENKFPGKTLGDDKWYLVAVAALVGSTEPEHVASVYQYLISKPGFTTSESRQLLVRRIREALVKCVSIIGVCKPLEAIFAVAKLERPEDRDYSFSRQHWKSGLENHERGVGWLQAIYKGNIKKIGDSLAAHKDFFWISEEITYGLYLSDHTILGPIETELVVLAGIMIQNLPLETAWHLRGTRRVGVSSEDVECIQQCIEMVAEFCRLSLHRVPRVADIEHEV